MRKLAAAAAVLLLAGCGDPLLFAELEIPSVAIVLPSQSFPAATAGPDNQCPPPDTGTDCIYQTFSYDIGSQVSILNDSGVKADVRLMSLSLALTAGVLQNFGTVDEVTLFILPPAGSTLSPVVVAEYRRSASDPAPTSIRVAGYSNVDLAQYLSSGKLQTAAEMKFNAVTPDFTADVTGDFYLKVQLDYGKLAGI